VTSASASVLPQCRSGLSCGHPSFAAHDASKRGASHPETSGQLREVLSGVVTSPDVGYLIPRQFGVDVCGANTRLQIPEPTFGDAITHVVKRCAHKEMIGIYAWRVVALVAEVVRGPFTTNQEPSYRGGTLPTAFVRSRDDWKPRATTSKNQCAEPSPRTVRPYQQTSGPLRRHRIGLSCCFRGSTQCAMRSASHGDEERKFAPCSGA